MATIRCPRGCRWISQRNNITFEFVDVDIFNGVCDHSDHCDIRDCEYFDDTPEGTRRFIDGMNAAETIEGRLADKRLEAELRAKRKRLSL
jgi:hypothetical protein